MNNKYKKSFASDNNAIAHPKVLEAIERVNTGHVLSYGEDEHTERVQAKFREVLGYNAEVFFVLNGTGANITGLAAVTSPYQGIVCTEAAHIHTDECGAPERFIGCKLLPVKAEHCKLTPGQIESLLHAVGVEHHTQPHVISITQSTEVGTVYTVEEVRELADFAHTHNMLLHMDGARISNAAASLGVTLKELTNDAGVDVLSFGGSKNGMMIGEAVVFFRHDLAESYKYIRKQGMQLASKTRYIAAQFEAMLTDDLWLKNASRANKMAKLLEREVRGIPGIKILHPVEANGVFVSLPNDAAERIKKKYFFYCMNEELGEYRWMTSFDMDVDDVMDFVDAVKESMQSIK